MPNSAVRSVTTVNGSADTEIPPRLPDLRTETPAFDRNERSRLSHISSKVRSRGEWRS